MSTMDGACSRGIEPSRDGFAFSWLLAIFACSSGLLFANLPLSLVALGTAAVLIGSFLKLDFLFYLMVLLLPLAPITEIGDFPIHDLASFSRILLFAGIFTRRIFDGEPLAPWLWRGRFEKWTISLFAVALISAAVVHPLEAGSARSLFRLVSYLLFYYALTGWLRSGEQLRKTLLWLFAGTLAVCALAFHQIAFNSLGEWFSQLYYNQMDVAPLWEGRPTSVFLGVNSLAAHLNMVIPVALAILCSRGLDHRIRGLARLCLFISIIVLVLTLSRGAFLAFFVMLAIAFGTVLKRNKRVFWKCLALILSAAIIGTAVSYLAVEAAADTSATSTLDRFRGADEATLVRLVIYSAAWKMFTASPMMGIGYGNFRDRFNSSTGTGPDDLWDAHSLYFKFLAETGTIGFLCFLGMIACVVRLAHRSWRQGSDEMERLIGTALLGSVATVMVQGLVESLIENPQFGSTLWFLFALLMAASALGGKQESAASLVRSGAAGGES